MQPQGFIKNSTAIEYEWKWKSILANKTANIKEAATRTTSSYFDQKGLSHMYASTVEGGFLSDFL